MPAVQVISEGRGVLGCYGIQGYGFRLENIGGWEWMNKIPYVKRMLTKCSIQTVKFHIILEKENLAIRSHANAMPNFRLQSTRIQGWFSCRKKALQNWMLFW